MTIEYDPHQNIDGNVQRGERHTINVSQPFRVVVPTHAPFYYTSLVVKQNGKELKENVHYYVSHRYHRGIHQTARLCYGSIWIIDKSLGGTIELDYHPLGINSATAQEITAERTRNANETPTDLDWEEVVGEKYFPPVNIIFDRDEWRGEGEVIDALNSLADAIEGGGWPFAKEYSPTTEPTIPGAKKLAPEPLWDKTDAVFCVKEVLEFTGNPVDFMVKADNFVDIYVDGVSIFRGTDYLLTYTHRETIPVGKHTIAFVVRNGTAGSQVSFKIQEVGKAAILSDTTWRCAVLGEGLTLEDAVRPIGGDSDIYGMLDNWYKALKHLYDTAPAHAHVIDKDNPHGEEYGWIQALERDGVAKNATKAFNKTLAELTTYVNQRSMTTADFAGKINRNGDTLLGKMIMQEGFGLITGNGGTSNLLKIVSKAIDFTSSSNGTVRAGASTPHPIHFKAGKNVLSLYPDNRKLQYNGVEVLTKDSVSDYVPLPDGADAGIISKSTQSVTMTGLGTSGNKLRIEWKIPPQSEAGYTMRPLANTFGTSHLHGATPKLIKDLSDIIPTKITLAKARINGYNLQNSIFLNPADFGLGRVVNLSDKDLPISDPQQAHLDLYIVGSHTHAPSAFGINHATEAVAGTFKLQPVGSSKTEALRSQDVREQRGRLTKLGTDIDNLMPAGVITILRYGQSGIAPVSGVTSSGYLLTFTKAMPYYCDGLHQIPAKTFNLKEMFPNMGEEQTLYVYANYIGDVAKYEIYDFPKAEDDTLTQIGTVNCNEISITSVNIRNVTRLGSFRELDEHRQNASAHVEKPKDRNDLGLGSFVNAETRYNIAKPTFQQIFDKWYRFSHGAAASTPGTHNGAGNVQPANPSEVDSWTYDSANDAVVQPINTGSFVGFISPTKHETYLFDTILSSNYADNDLIGVVIGFYRDGSGRERTLSWSCRQDGGTGSLKGAALCLDYNQTTQRITPIKPTVNLAAHSNWGVTGPRRIRIERNGDNYRLDMYKQNDVNTVEEIFYFNISTGEYSSFVSGTKAQSGTLDAATVNELKPFRGAQPFGYCAHSQPFSTYKNLKRPDEDGKNFYASVPEVMEAISPMSMVRIFSGRSANLIGKNASQYASVIPAPVIKNYLGESIPVPTDRITYYVNGDVWTQVCHIDATVLVNPPA